MIFTKLQDDRGAFWTRVPGSHTDWTNGRGDQMTLEALQQMRGPLSALTRRRKWVVLVTLPTPAEGFGHDE